GIAGDDVGIGGCRPTDLIPGTACHDDAGVVGDGSVGSCIRADAAAADGVVVAVDPHAGVARACEIVDGEVFNDVVGGCEVESHRGACRAFDFDASAELSRAVDMSAGGVG